MEMNEPKWVEQRVELQWINTTWIEQKVILNPPESEPTKCQCNKEWKWNEKGSWGLWNWIFLENYRFCNSFPFVWKVFPGFIPIYYPYLSAKSKSAECWSSVRVHAFRFSPKQWPTARSSVQGIAFPDIENHWFPIVFVRFLASYENTSHEKRADVGNHWFPLVLQGFSIWS